jgi:DNA-binding MarR family transcriptional regulator
LAAEAWGTLLRVHAALVPAIDREVHAETNLPLSWYDVLLELTAAPEGRLRMSDLADRVVLSRTRVSRLVDELVVKGLVRKEEHPHDKRSAFAVVTPAGAAEFRNAAPVYLRAIETRFAHELTNEELRVIRDLLERVLARS